VTRSAIFLTQTKARQMHRPCRPARKFHGHSSRISDPRGRKISISGRNRIPDPKQVRNWLLDAQKTFRAIAGLAWPPRGLWLQGRTAHGLRAFSHRTNRLPPKALADSPLAPPQFPAARKRHCMIAGPCPEPSCTGIPVRTAALHVICGSAANPAAPAGEPFAPLAILARVPQAEENPLPQPMLADRLRTAIAAAGDPGFLPTVAHSE